MGFLAVSILRARPRSHGLNIVGWATTALMFARRGRLDLGLDLGSGMSGHVLWVCLGLLPDGQRTGLGPHADNQRRDHHPEKLVVLSLSPPPASLPRNSGEDRAARRAVNFAARPFHRVLTGLVTRLQTLSRARSSNSE